MLSTILSLLGLLPKALDTVQSITGMIRDEKLAQISATTDQQRISSQERQVQLEARRDVLISEATNPASAKINACTRLLLALSALLLWFKLGAWDKAIGSWHGCTNPILLDRPDNCYLFRTDTLDPNMWWFMIAVVGFYFLTKDKQ